MTRETRQLSGATDWRTGRMLAVVVLLALTVLSGRAQSLSTVVTNNPAVPPGIVEPHSLVTDTTGIIYFTDQGGIFGIGESAHRILAFNPTTAILSILAGDFSGRPGTNSGVGFSARFFNPAGIALARGGLVVADSGNHAIRYVGLDGVVTNIVGGIGQPGFVNGAGTAARFNTPIGLAVDTSGNIYVADSINNVVRKIDPSNVVTTFATGFNQPNGLAVGDGGEVWVADTLNNQIKAILADQSVVVRAGQGTSGFADSFPDASQALLSGPRSVLWMGAGAGLLVSDTGNHVVRRLFTNTTTATYTIETSVGGAGEAGFTDGEQTAARLSSPLGLSGDVLAGAFLVVDSANRGIRRIQQTAALPPISDPRVGYVVLEEDSLGNVTTRLVSVTHSTFNNEVPIQIVAESGVDTFYTFADTPTNVFIDTVPDPTEASLQATSFTEGGTTLPGSIVQNVVPDMTMKAQSSQDGRVSSGIISARFQFKVSNPEVVGDNAAAFTLNNLTTNSQMFYTVDGSEPTNAPPSLGPVAPGSDLSFNLTSSNLVFKARAFKSGFEPSATISNVFSATDFTANRISFGFASGVGSSSFRAASGSTFYAPVTMSLLDDAQLMMSLQFSLLVTNDTGPAVTPGAISYDSALRRLLGTGELEQIPPQMFVGLQTQTVVIGATTFTNISPVMTNLMTTNASINLLSVGYLERRLGTNLFNSTEQTLIQFSQAHDVLFQAVNQQVVVGGFSFVVPAGATNGQEYRMRLIRPSATADGISKDVFIDAPTNGSLTSASPINAVRTVVVDSPQYLVGDVTPFRWWNAGDFGDTNILNNDILSVFRAAVYQVNQPLAGSDFEDAMDACCGTAVLDAGTGHLISDGGTISTAAIQSGADVAINSSVFGDGTLDVADVFIHFRRSLDPSLTNYARFRSNGVHYAIATSNLFRGQPSSLVSGAGTGPFGGQSKQIANATAAVGERRVVFSADAVSGVAGQVVSVPIRAEIIGSDPIRVLALNLSVRPIASSDPSVPELDTQVSFVPAAGFGNPQFSLATSVENISATWLDPSIAGLSGNAVVGHLLIRIPSLAGANAAYSIEFQHASGSSTGVDTFASRVVNGLITLGDSTASSLADGIPDGWRLRFFQTASISENLLISSTADADGDGFLNWQEFRAGTNPIEALSALQVKPERMTGLGGLTEGVRLRFPTIDGKTYVVEYSDAPLAGVWTTLGANITGTGAHLDYLASAGAGQAPRFYRVRLVEP